MKNQLPKIQRTNEINSVEFNLNTNDIVNCKDTQPDFVNNGFDWKNFDPIIFDPEFSEKELSVIDEQAISDISKTVFEKLLRSTVCDECRSFLETSGICNDSVNVPSEVFALNFKKIIGKIDESLEYICAESGLKRTVVNSLQSVKLDRMGCDEHFSHVEKKFKEYSTVFGTILFCKKVNNILNRKNNIFSENFNLIEQLAFNFCKKKKQIGKYSEKFDERM